VTPLIDEAAYDTEVIERAKKKGTIQWETDPKKAVNDAEYVYTDTWINMEFFNDPSYQKEKDHRIKVMAPYQINSELLKNSKAKIMHDMPIHTGFEISREAVKSERSIIFQQAENRLDSQKAIMLHLLNPINC
jgi:ornithine carbamoyltransferase